MFRFEHQEYLIYLVGLVPLMILFYLGWIWYRRQQATLGDMRLITGLTPSLSLPRKKWAIGLACVIFGLLVVAWANPQWGAKREKVDVKAADIFLAFDISNSMYVQDVPPNRLEQAKRFTEKLTNKLRGERIGLILFAGNAYLQMPLTTDYAAAQLFIRSASPELAGTQGTAIGDAISTAMEYFDQNEKFHRTLIIISDGEDHDTEALEEATAAFSHGLQIFTVGVGTAEGGHVPIMVDGRQDWKRDQQGQPVQSRINEVLLRAVAEAGGGSYYNLGTQQNILEGIDEKVDEMEKREIQEHSFTAYESYFQVFLGLAIFGMLFHWTLENGVSNRKQDYV
ncbi:MAG: VWA domain-containing protein [Saprospiraceae bacterium]|nr:VWA domain-containing protein [Saprospiraceae bacterium]